jgi:hypothetical protein
MWLPPNARAQAQADNPSSSFPLGCLALTIGPYGFSRKPTRMVTIIGHNPTPIPIPLRLSSFASLGEALNDLASLGDRLRKKMKGT